MADLYVGSIASALQEYNKYADPQGLIPYQVYEDLAWGGLMDAPIFEETFPPGTDNYIRIKNRYRCESSGHSVEEGTSNEQKLAGKPCN